MLTKYSNIITYWNNHPCDGGRKEFVFSACSPRKILEIGCGTGNDAKKFVDAGYDYTGIDLTPMAILKTKLKIGNKGKAFIMNAEYLDFPDNYFDLVYSWGVIHHTINPQNVINEIYRVLKPHGIFSVMLYNKPSFRYNIEIMFLRKILWWLHYPAYKEIRRETPHPTKEQWVSWNTDTLGCPVARVYTKNEALDLFKKFSIQATYTINKGWFRIIYGNK